jgi:glutamate formiminotransferase/glutamate formiminotransferase/formiminotetrahydrofolate cyclodeaminase
MKLMPHLIECVPNFSEGRNPSVLQALLTAVTSVPRIWLLHHTADPDHHRSVLTFAGPPDAVGEAALRAITAATELIDLRQHDGVHPRIGATDVVPFVPIHDDRMDECIRVARWVGQEVGTRLGIPVFLYEDAASNPARRQLESVRLGGTDGLASRMESDPAWIPDFGPPHLHQTAGAIVVGARRPLIAFNANLKTNDLSIAKRIANLIRQSSGGLPCLKAIGVKLASRGIVQVAMNLTDYRVTPMHRAFQAVQAEAAKLGVEVAGSELIGLAPQAALDQAAVAALQLERFDSDQILEVRIAAATVNTQIADLPLSDFLDAVAAAKPTPAGGSVGALVGALAASLGIMGTRLGPSIESEHQLTQLQQQLHQLIQDDAGAYNQLMCAYKIPKQEPHRPQAISTALRTATEIPMEIAELACEVGRLIHGCIPSVKPAVRSDMTVGIILAVAAAESGLHTASVNIQLNQELKSSMMEKLDRAIRNLEELKRLCYTPPPFESGH